MTVPDDRWPDYLPGPKDHLLGVISLVSGSLEGMFKHLFRCVTGMDKPQVNALFQRIPNNTRQDIMLELLDPNLPENLRAAIKYFCDGFETCAENRHGLMHSHSSGNIVIQRTGHYGFIFRKSSRAGNPLGCTPSMEDLKEVADSMHRYMLFAAAL